MDLTREQDENGVRWYTDGEVEYVSVSHILKELDEDTTGLDIWQDRNDGGTDKQGREAPHHAHLLWYYQNRGTLAHYQALKRFEDSFDGDGEDEEMWTEEEQESMMELTNGPSEDAFEEYDEDISTDNDDVLYSILKKRQLVESRPQFDERHRDNTRIINVAHRDLDFFVETFGDICGHLSLSQDSVIAVERYMLRQLEGSEWGYGGQTDCVYTDPRGNVVVADLKTSSGLRWKHRLQAVAYAKGIEDELDITADRVEVIRIDPDGDTWQIHSSTVPEHVQHLYDEGDPESSKYTDAHWLEDKWGEFQYDSTEEMWNHFKTLVEKAHEKHT